MGEALQHIFFATDFKWCQNAEAKADAKTDAKTEVRPELWGRGQVVEANAEITRTYFWLRTHGDNANTKFQCAAQLYFAFIHPHLSYGITNSDTSEGPRGAQSPAPIWAPCNSMSTPPDWINKVLFYAQIMSN